MEMMLTWSSVNSVALTPMPGPSFVPARTRLRKSAKVVSSAMADPRVSRAVLLQPLYLT